MANQFNAFTREEVDSIYCGEDDRFVVSYIVGYRNEYPDDADAVTVRTPKDAAYWALQLTQDPSSADTHWFVYDRETKQMHEFEQGEFAFPELDAEEEE